MTSKIEILGQNFAHFGRFEGSFLTIFGVKNSLSRHFRNLKKKGQLVSHFATHTFRSPLGSREALINVDKASPGLFISLVSVIKPSSYCLTKL